MARLSKDHNEQFDGDRDFVVVRGIPVSGHRFDPGDLFDKTLVTTRLLRQMYEQRILKFASEKPRSRVKRYKPKSSKRVERIRLQRRRLAGNREENVPAEI